MDPKLQALEELKKMLEQSQLGKLKGMMPPGTQNPLKVEQTSVEMQDSKDPEPAVKADSDVQDMIQNSDEPSASETSEGEGSDEELLKKIYEMLQ